MPNIAYVNGTFSRLEDAKISINDRGLQFGDSIYEVIRTRDGLPFLLERHLIRLRDECSALGILADRIISQLPAVIEEGLKRSAHEETLIYIQVTRGIQERNHIYDSSLTPSIIVTFRELVDTYQGQYENGVAIQLLPDTRHTLCHLKTTNLLGHILSKNEARRQGAFEAVLVGQNNQIHEGCSSSVFIVEGRAICTPPVGQHVLPGVSREYVLQNLGPKLGLKCLEEEISVDRFLRASEVFLATTSYFVMPVVRINEHLVGQGTPGLVTRLLQDTYAREMLDPTGPEVLTETSRRAAANG